ncbi:PREDICTED: isochorismatase domain-containing protein 1 [Galeopterus variegatus]|uniref:Isochorismatase domain-containing protein 1 n=1 Tax=Galeopterus variegatus TaxID=482537 RepID=A0ABM0Q0Z4_GALVR|nr:PREDICTED: isochorismatase domain-containing protein 1 [Galeopterus variegatus]
MTVTSVFIIGECAVKIRAEILLQPKLKSPKSALPGTNNVMFKIFSKVEKVVQRVSMILYPDSPIVNILHHSDNICHNQGTNVDRLLLTKLTTLGNLTSSSTVFFCCDMQERFRPAIKYFGDIISVGQRLLQGARILGIPVIVTEQYPKGLGSTVQEIDLTGVKLVLPKTKFSMVLPEVEAALAEIPGVRSVVLFGVETHVCIQQTALELVGRGIEVHIVADATSSRSMMDRMFALERLARTGIIVTTSEAILLQLVADKDHPKFKEIQNLIKASAPESGLLSKV